MLALRNIIGNEKLFDPRNKHIVVCDREMEKGLDVKAFHTSQLQTLVAKQTKVIAGFESAASLRKCQQELLALSFWNQCTIFSNAYTGPINQHSLNFDIEASYTVSPGLLKAIRGFAGIGPKGTVWPYRKICSAVALRIMSNKHLLFDLRNITIAMVRDDLLGKAFGMDHFSRSQITNLIRSQLKVVKRSKRLRDQVHRRRLY